LVNTFTLADVAKTLGVNDFLLLSKGESKDVGRGRLVILADAMEAIIGAVYLDGGYNSARDFISKNIFHLIDEIVAEGKHIDAKSKFQERAQDVLGFTPVYKSIKETGPDHDKHFMVAVFVGDERIAEGGGKSKQEAEQDAAREALKEKGWL
jgi:ribonuclease-3